jgi:DnaK suppressor protein
VDLEYFREKLLKLRDELQEIEQTGSEAAQTVELDQSRVGRLSRMDALQAQAMSIESGRRRNIKIKRIDRPQASGS